MDRVRQPGLSARIGVAGMNRPSVMEAHLPLPQGHGDNANLPALRTELLFHLTQILLVEKPNVLQARPAMASGHHDERTASDVHRVEWNPHRDHLVRTAGRPVCSVRVPAGHGARCVLDIGRFVNELIVQHANGGAPSQLRRDGAQERMDGKSLQLTLLQRHELVVSLAVPIARFPVGEARVEGDGTIPLSPIEAFGSLACRVNQGFGQDTLFGDVVTIRLVERHVRVVGQEGTLLGSQARRAHDGLSTVGPIVPSALAGTPTATTPSARSRVATAPAPRGLQLPILTPGITTLPMPRNAPSPTCTEPARCTPGARCA